MATEQDALTRVRAALGHQIHDRAPVCDDDIPLPFHVTFGDLRALCDELEAKRRECEALLDSLLRLRAGFEARRDDPLEGDAHYPYTNAIIDVDRELEAYNVARGKT